MLLFLQVLINAAWKVPKYRVFSSLYFPVFGLNTEIYSANTADTHQKELRIWTLFTRWNGIRIRALPFFTNVINSLQNFWFEEKEFIRCDWFIFNFNVWRNIEIFKSSIDLVKWRIFYYCIHNFTQFATS